MKTSIKAVIVLSVGLAGSSAFADTSVFPSSAEEFPPIVAPVRADRYAQPESTRDVTAEEGRAVRATHNGMANHRRVDRVRIPQDSTERADG